MRRPICPDACWVNGIVLGEHGDDGASLPAGSGEWGERVVKGVWEKGGEVKRWYALESLYYLQIHVEVNQTVR